MDSELYNFLLQKLRESKLYGLHSVSKALFCCSLLYGAEDPSIAGMVLDSPFSNLFDLMMELVDVYKIRLPKFTVCFSFVFFQSGYW